MPISHGDQLFEMIQSLTKAEKRNFRLYAKRIQGESDAKFLQLFDFLEKQKDFDEELIIRKLKDSNKSQLSNLKRHLYQHILTCLRLMEIHKSEEIQIREWIDYAVILYGKGLYLQSLKLLAKAKTLANKLNHDILQLEIVEFEKRIESRHITRSTTQRMDELQRESEEHSDTNLSIALLSNFKLALQRHFINNGHVKTTEERLALEKDFRDKLPKQEEDAKTFFQKIHIYHAYYWYHYLLQEYDKCQEYAAKWVNLYASEPKMIEMDMDMYMIGMHQLLVTAFYLRNYPVFIETLDRFEKFRKEVYPKFNYNSQILSFLFVHQGRFNRHFLEGSFQEGTGRTLQHTLRRIRRYDNKLDAHKLLIFYFKIAWLWMGAGKPTTAIDYLNLILNHPGKALREDMQAYASLLFIMAHYDLKNVDFLDYVINNTARFISKMSDPSKLQKASISFFRRLLNARPDDTQKLFQDFRKKLEELKASDFEKRSFIFLDLESWVESKIQHKSLAQVVKERHERRLEQGF
jgi:hypothetical protein